MSFRPNSVHRTQLDAGLGVGVDGQEKLHSECPVQDPEGRLRGELLRMLGNMRAPREAGSAWCVGQETVPIWGKAVGTAWGIADSGTSVQTEPGRPARTAGECKQDPE